MTNSGRREKWWTLLQHRAALPERVVIYADIGGPSTLPTSLTSEQIAQALTELEKLRLHMVATSAGRTAAGRALYDAVRFGEIALALAAQKEQT